MTSWIGSANKRATGSRVEGVAGLAVVRDPDGHSYSAGEFPPSHDRSTTGRFFTVFGPYFGSSASTRRLSTCSQKTTGSGGVAHRAWRTSVVAQPAIAFVAKRSRDQFPARRPPATRRSNASTREGVLRPPNGRVGRALVYAILRRRGLLGEYVPLISLVLNAAPRSYTSSLAAYQRRRSASEHPADLCRRGTGESSRADHARSRPERAGRGHLSR